MKLEDIRLEINKIDSEMVRLFEERMKCVKNVALYKQENNMPIFDESREQFVIAKNLELINDDELKIYYESYIKSVMTISKEYQKNLLKK